jgi:hypothetical protein
MSSKQIKWVVAALALGLVALAGIAQAEVAQKGTIRVQFDGQLTPNKLPRSGGSPVKVSVSAKISPTNSKAPAPQMTRLEIEINKFGVLDSTGLPVCDYDEIQPATTSDALAVCRNSLVGEGRFTANVPESGRSPFPSDGKLYAFNGEIEGRPAVLAHVYGVRPAPVSFTLAFIIGHAKGKFGTSLSVDLPKSTGGGYITGISLDLFKTFSFKGKKRSFISASCPAPKGFGSANFAFAKASFAFVGGKNITSTLNRTCKVSGK